MANRFRQMDLSGGEAPCVFCMIISREASSYIVYEDKESLAFLDSRPLFPGHLLLVPKAHYSSIKDLPDGMIGKLFANVRMLSGAVEKAAGADGAFIAINENVSQSVPHMHIHIVPRRFKDGLKGFFWPRHKYSGDEEMQSIQKRIIKAIG